MDGWTDEWKTSEVGRWMDGQMNGKHQRMDGQMNNLRGGMVDI